MYREGNNDVIGTMFYKNRGINIWKNLDMEYPSYTCDLPLLIPSEIGLGWLRAPRTWGQINILNLFEKGGLGFAVYCYGELIDIYYEGSHIRSLRYKMKADETKNIVVPGIMKNSPVFIATRPDIDEIHAGNITVKRIY